MEICLIKNEKKYLEYLEWVGQKFDENVSPDSKEGEKLKVVLLLIKAYEDEHYPIPYPDPLAAIHLKMEENGLKNKDFVGQIGTKGHVSSILSGRKPLTLDIARFFHKKLNIPAEILLS